MSKIGKKLIKVPGEVDVKISGDSVVVKGPKGELSRIISSQVVVTINGDKIAVSLKTPDSKDKKSSALWGLTKVLIDNMIKGVSDGFERVLEFEGVGYKANVKGDILELSLGYSHTIFIKTPPGIFIKTEKSTIKVSGIDKELVGHVAAEIKSKRLPEPYKGSGIRYAGEVIRRKAGKKAATAA